MFCCVIETSDIGDEYGSVRPLDEARTRRLNVNRVRLLDLIDPNPAFVTELANPRVGCITWPQRDHLINIIQPRDRNEKLIDLLTRRSVADFEKFIEVLSKEQAHLVPLLVTDAGDSFLVCLSQHINMTLTQYNHCLYGSTSCCISQWPSQWGWANFGPHSSET